jgi:hypothetical protein
MAVPCGATAGVDIDATQFNAAIVGRRGGRRSGGVVRRRLGPRSAPWWDSPSGTSSAGTRTVVVLGANKSCKFVAMPRSMFATRVSMSMYRYRKGRRAAS